MKGLLIVINIILFASLCVIILGFIPIFWKLEEKVPASYEYISVNNSDAIKIYDVCDNRSKCYVLGNYDDENKNVIGEVTEMILLIRNEESLQKDIFVGQEVDLREIFCEKYKAFHKDTEYEDSPQEVTYLTEGFGYEFYFICDNFLDVLNK